MEIHKKKAVIYVRVSTKDQAIVGSSLASQEFTCREYADRNNYEIVQTFVERGESARTDDRTELIKLISFCKQRTNSINAVIFHKIDRWARLSFDYGNLKKTLKDYGITIQSATENIEDTPAGRFMENVLASQAQFDNDVRIERCKNGMKDAVREGRFVWAAPVGYANAKIGGKSNIVPDDNAVLIRQAFEEVAKSKIPVELIRQKLMKEGLSNSKGTRISRPQFYRMLRNQLYCGWIVMFGERHKGMFEPIVSQELFDHVQSVLRGSKIPKLIYKKDRPELPLRRFIKHPSGHSLGGCNATGRDRKYPYYRLRNPTRYFPKKNMESMFQQLLNNFELSEQHFSKLRIKVKQHLVTAKAEKAKSREDAKKYIQTIKQKQHLLIQKNIDGIISDQVLKTHLEIFESDLLKAQSTLLEIPHGDVRFDLLMDKVSNYLKNPAEIWANAPLVSQLKLQWFTFPKGLVFDGEKLLTTEVCSLFNGKTDNSGSLSHVVYHPSSKTNPIPSQRYSPMNDLPKEARLKTRPANDPVHWNNIGLELIQLSEILTEGHK